MCESVKEKKRDGDIGREREGMIERVFVRKIYCVRGRESEREREIDRDR